MVTDSDLAFNTPEVASDHRPRQGQRPRRHHERVGTTLALLVGGNYVNRFNLNGRSYDVIPQVPRRSASTPEQLGAVLRRTASGETVPLSTVVSIETGVEPNALDAVQPAQLRDLLGGAAARRHHGPGGRLSSSSSPAEVLPDGLHHDYLVGVAAVGAARATSRRRLRLRAHHDLPGAGGAVRELARPAGHPGSVPLSIFGALLPLYIGPRRPSTSIPRSA